MRWVESSIQDKLWIIQTNGHVLWNVQFTSNILSNDGFYFWQHDLQFLDYRLHGRHVYLWKRLITIDHEYKIGPMTITGQWFIFETIKMWIPQNEDWIPWNDHWRRKNIHGYFEVNKDPRLAHSFYCQTSQRIFGIWKLLLTIYLKLLWHCTTSEWTPKEGQKICLDPQVSIFFWWNAETIHRRTCLGHAWSFSTISNRNGCFEICNCSSPVTIGFKQWSTSCSILFQNIFPCRTKLRHPW